MRNSLLALAAATPALLWLAPAALAADESSPQGSAATALPPAATVPPGVFFVDLLPQNGLVTFAAPNRPDNLENRVGGLARLSPAGFEVVVPGLVFPHDISPLGDGFAVSETQRDRVVLLSPAGQVRAAVDRVVWLSGDEAPLRRVNWFHAVERQEVELFLGHQVPESTYVLLSCMNSLPKKPDPPPRFRWAICSLTATGARAVWERDLPPGKAHAALLHRGTLYGAASTQGALVVVDQGREFAIPAGDIRYMEIADGRLWMARDGSVAVFDQLPASAEARPRVFCDGIGRAQAVHVWDDRVWVTANGMILVYDLAGTLLQRVGAEVPEAGTSELHDQLRALGYLSD